MPAPKPHMRTRSPGATRPDSATSASDSGTEPADERRRRHQRRKQDDRPQAEGHLPRLLIDAERIPVSDEVRGACELLGLDPLHVANEGTMVVAVAREALAVFRVDERGLDKVDASVLDALIRRFGGGPVGLSTLAVAVGEEPDTVEDVYEPYLMQLKNLRTVLQNDFTDAGVRSAESAIQDTRRGADDVRETLNEMAEVAEDVANRFATAGTTS